MSTHAQGSFFRNKGTVLSAHAEFLQLTGSRYSAMTKRFQKRTRSGRVIHLPLPFSLDRFRDFILQMLGGEQGTVRCEYCNWPLSIHTLQFDHRHSIAQGGSLGLENLAPCCESCNQQKGEMNAPAYLALLMLVNNDERLAGIGVPKFSGTDRVNLLGRLQRSLKLAKRVRMLEKATLDTVVQESME